ncbi:putative fimbrial chaperone YadV [Pseudomonas marincola]|uniref:Chaperone protein EcpD n=1 Tax=Pseudomonas marincola TaxID=437900 RepID=A0A653E851_9PSED|nr:fimbria/pilus periplasmic chaperone [Pseudomonas marincola]CAE6916599.1 putative fimbrial chaperone YadV [Pseudomonas marincola]
MDNSDIMTMRSKFVFTALLLSLSISSLASVTISGTRIIYPAQEREVTIDLNNKNDTPALIQSWIGTGDSKVGPGEEQLPFIVTPPLTRIEPNQGQSLRIAYTGEPLPEDVESVFWFNMLEVPPIGKDAKGNNYIQLAYRSQLKFFFRPEGLSGNPKAAGVNVSWSIAKADQGYVLRGTNDSAFHISIAGATLTVGGKDYPNQQGGMIPPKSTFDYKLEGLNKPVAGGKVSYRWINDFGSITTTESKLSSD